MSFEDVGLLIFILLSMFLFSLVAELIMEICEGEGKEESLFLISRIRKRWGHGDTWERAKKDQSDVEPGKWV